mgnify:CR=1 FL=1
MNEIVNALIFKTPISTLWGSFREINIKGGLHLEPKSHANSMVYQYDLEKLKRDLKYAGQLHPLKIQALDTEPPWERRKHKKIIRNKDKYEYMVVLPQYKWKVVDGNHRSLAFLELYGEDYEIDVLDMNKLAKKGINYEY